MTRSNCRPTVRTPKRAPPSRASCCRGDCCSPPAIPAHADVLERTILNGVLAGVGLDGVSFSYENPLQRRTHRVAEEDGVSGALAVVPVCVLPAEPHAHVRLVPAYLATTDDGGVTIHQYASSEIAAPWVVVPRSACRWRPTTRGRAASR